MGNLSEGLVFAAVLWGMAAAAALVTVRTRPEGALLTALKRESDVTLQRDYTSITAQKNHDFKFVFLCNTEFGLNLTDPAVDLSLSVLPGRDDLPGLLDSLQAAAGRCEVTLSRKPEQISSQRMGNFYQFTYGISARASYKNIVQWIVSMNKARLPVAFSKLTITASTPGVVLCDAVVRIMFSEHH